jgi:hypothetical protein
MRQFKLFIFIFSLSVVMAPAAAEEGENTDIVIKLSSIKPQLLNQKSGNKIYLTVASSSSLGNSKVNRIPAGPAYWQTKHLSTIHNLAVWEGAIKDNEEIKLVFTVVEQDALSWDTDNLMGSAQVGLTNKRGKLGQPWELPVFEEKVDAERVDDQEIHHFILKANHSQYKVAFLLEAK